MASDIKQRLEVFFKENMSIHIDTIEGLFFNGLILEIKDNYVLLDEKKLGKYPVLYSDIKLLRKELIK